MKKEERLLVEVPNLGLCALHDIHSLPNATVAIVITTDGRFHRVPIDEIRALKELPKANP